MDAAKRQIETSPMAWATQCGVCHVGGGALEHDRDMLPYGQAGANNEGDRYTYLGNRIVGGAVTAGGIVELTAPQTTQLFADNNVEVDCMMCHANTLQTGAAWYKSIGCSDTNMVGPADNPNCDSTNDATGQPDSRFTWVNGSYDSFNRNAAVSAGWFKQAASAGIGAAITLSDGSLSGTPATIPASVIAYAPNSANCAICHARNENDTIGLPGEAQMYGGMIVGFGNYFRMTPAGNAFDFDEINTDGTSCGDDCKNNTQWNEFGCKTGMGKRAQKTGYGSSDRFGFGICFGCAMFSAMNGGPMAWWVGMDGIEYTADDGVCALPSVRASCNTKAGADIVANPMNIYDGMGYPKQIAGKMPDVDVHDMVTSPDKDIKCGTCHYAVSGTTAAKTISATVGGTAYTYTYASKSIEKIDHMIAQGYSTLEKANDYLDGTVTCEGCHSSTGTHPNKAALNPPDPDIAGGGHVNIPALHFEKIDCRTCHIPSVYAAPGRLLLRDWSAGAYRQADGSNGNANHFDFAYNFMDGGAVTMPTLRAWIKTPEGTKIAPILPSTLTVWTGSAVRASDDFVLGWSPAKTRDITAAAAIVSANNSGFGIRINGTNEHPPFEGFQLADPIKIDSAAKIGAMVTELGAARATGYANHAKVGNARLNIFPTLFDPSHGVTPKAFALGSPSSGGCIMCHSSSNTADATYSSKSVGFFDSKKELLKNGMVQMADYDCGGGDMDYETGGWLNADHPDWYCGMFDPLAMGGDNDGTCDTSEVMACRGYVASNLYPQFGMPADIPMLVDGISMMQMMAIREGAFGFPSQGKCDPRYSFFGFGNGPDTSRGDDGYNNGCYPQLGDYYSRDEIRAHYKKNMQQVKFQPAGLPSGAQWVNPITNVTGAVPTTMGRVFGIVKVAQHPSNAAHANIFDLGASCKDPSTGATIACGDAPSPSNPNYVQTTVTANQLLGYTASMLSYLEDYYSLGSLVHPVASFSWGSDGTTSLKVNFNASGSTCNTGSTCTYTWKTCTTKDDPATPAIECGTEVAMTAGITTSYTYTAGGAGIYKATLTVTDTTYGLISSTSKQVQAKVINTAPVAAKTSPVVAGKLVTYTDSSSDAQDAQASLKVTTTWGDGATTVGVGGALQSHTYLRGGIYTIRHKVTDTGGLSKFSANVTVTVN
ncbi:MAG: hypothetical protein HY755_10690 [Nitrospirae bacterium]|nr:hypothetical protein [Nitrospirota bacterium]